MFKDNPKGADGPIRIKRHPTGLPQVAAASWRDAFQGLGWLHARDRGAQLALTRAVAQGRLCELLGDKDGLLETDLYFRRLGLARDAQSHVKGLDASGHEILRAYAQGVNERWARRRPAVLRLTGYRPEPFAVADVLLLIKLTAFAGLAEGQRNTELFVMEAIRRGVGGSRLHALFPALDDLDESLARAVAVLPPFYPDGRGETGAPVGGGSNAWVVAGSRSASGSPLLANDPHLEINRLPAVLYEARLQAGERWVKGSTLPGLPAFVTGRTPELAWGVTYNCADTCDFFVERCRGGEYLRDGQWHRFRERTETLLRKGGEPLNETFLETDQGTLQSRFKEDGDYLAWRWAGSGDGGLGAVRGFHGLLRSRDVGEAQRAAREIDIPPLHMVLADKQGNIGYQFTGRVPRRAPGDNGLAPIPAWDSNRHWRGWVDPETETPGELNPEEGCIVITNEARQRPGGPRLSTIWLAPYRQQRLTAALGEARKLTTGDMQRLQYDVYSLQAERFLAEYLRHMPHGPQYRLLSQWDHRYAVDSRAAPLFEAIHSRVIVHVFGDGGLGRDFLDRLFAQTGLYVNLVGFFDDVLAQADSPWLPAGERDRRIGAAVGEALQAATPTWGRVNRLLFRNLFLGQRMPRFMGFDKGPFGLAGNAATVHQGVLFHVGKRPSSFAPSYHFVTDLAEHSVWSNLPGGASESRLSRWYANELRRWLAGRYKAF